MTWVVRAETDDGRELPPGYWISKRDLALLVTEVETEGAKVDELKTVDIVRQSDAWWKFLTLVGAIGVIVGSVGASVLFAGGNLQAILH